VSLPWWAPQHGTRGGYEYWKCRCPKCRQQESDREKRRRESFTEEQRHKAHVRSTLRNAVKWGHVAKGRCEVCGSAEVHAHHESYDRWWDVRWLCAQHHIEAHLGQQ